MKEGFSVTLTGKMIADLSTAGLRVQAFVGPSENLEAGQRKARHR